MGSEVDVLVVAYGAPELLEQCLTTLGDRFTVAVVDNSSDPAVRAVAARHGARYTDPGTNLGFAAGVNLGIAQRAHPEGDLLLLNPDAQIDADGVERLRSCLHRTPDLACVAPVQTDPDGGRRDQVAWPFPSPFGAWVEAAGLGRLRRPDGFLIGSVLLIRGAALAEVGEFDTRFFLYAEETDWQWRARAIGWRVALCRDVTATHVGAGTGGDPQQREIHFHASQERYIRKHFGTSGWQVYRTGVLIGAAARGVVLPGVRGRRAANRFHLYRRGPSRVDEGRPGAGGPVETGTLGQRPTLAPEPLSIVHVVVTDNFAGVERYVCEVAGALADRGHHVTTVGGDPTRMPLELDQRVVCLPASSLVGAAIVLARQRDTDLIHVHMTSAEGAAWLARLRVRVPIVATRHFARERGSSALAKALSSVTTRSIACDIAISRFVADAITGPSVVIPNGVPDRPQAALDSTTAVMLQRLDREKSPAIGIRAWAASGLGRRGWRLTVAGKGELRPGLERLVDHLGATDIVEFAGQVADTDTLLAGAAVLLAPAPEEPFGLSVVEAMAHGLPVVAAGGGAHLETLGEVGLLFTPGDVEAAAAALVALADDPVVRRSVGHRLRVRQQERFTLARHAEQLESLYRSVIARAG
jgi:GT2 family glycosyltransferase/glycosyltransferase involved in cell wall biosynthesis